MTTKDTQHKPNCGLAVMLLFENGCYFELLVCVCCFIKLARELTVKVNVLTTAGQDTL